MNNSNFNWHLIYTMPKQEKKVVSRLSEMNIEFYLPLIKTINQWHDRKKTVDQPLFPSYVFIKINSASDYFKVADLSGVVTFVKIGKEIVKINPSIVKNVALALNNGSNIEVTSDSFKEGRQLFIQEGSLAGFSCEMIKFNGKERALVRINLINRNVVLDIPVDYIVA